MKSLIRISTFTHASTLTISFILFTFFLKILSKYFLSSSPIAYFLLLYIFHKKPVWAIPFCFLAMYKEPWALLGFGLTLTYNGERGRQNKIVNYFFYPVHLFVLGMIKMYFGFNNT